MTQRDNSVGDPFPESLKASVKLGEPSTATPRRSWSGRAAAFIVNELESGRKPAEAWIGDAFVKSFNFDEGAKPTPAVRLIQLKNGDWVRPGDIIGVAFLKPEKVFNMDFKPRLVVELLGRSNPVVIHFETVEEAVAYRDELAGLVNTAGK